MDDLLRRVALMIAVLASPAVLALLGTGFCGAYTTFSTYSYETVRLLESGELRPAATHALGSIAVGLLAAGLGLAITATW